MRAIGIPRVVIFYLVVAAVAVVSLWVQNDLWQVLAPATWGRAAGSVALGVAVGLSLVALSRLATARFSWARRLSQELRNTLGELNAREALVLASMSGIAEELLFRGVLQPALGLWIAAAIFGVLHIGPNRHFMPWTIMAFGAGLLFGVMFWWCGSLIAPILAHATVNFLNLKRLCAAGPTVEIHLGPMPKRGLVEP